jgi:cation diffusion facilitator CzcD-associated flavoprotein CzcO
VSRFGGVYQLKKLRDQGLKTKLIDAASDVGGTWYWYVAEALQRKPEFIPRY